MDWNTICKMMRNIDKQSEMTYQRGIKEMILEFGLGWSSDQITEQLSLQLGSTERLIPDLLVRKDERNSFIIEVKKPGHRKINSDIDQLLSYMKQLETPVGIYWGDEVEIYWKTIGDGSAPVPLLSLNFNVHCDDGDKFISLFLEENYSIDAVRAFKEEREAKALFEMEVNSLMTEITSMEFQDTVKRLITDFLVNKGLNEEVVEMVIGNVSVAITEEHEEEKSDDAVLIPDRPMGMAYQSRSRRSVGARPYAYGLMKQIIEKNCHLSFRELYSFFKKRNYVEVVSDIAEKRRDRWFVRPEEILTLSDGTKVAISNQWGFKNNSKPKMDFLRELAARFDIDASLPK